MGLIHEAVSQLRGEADERQVDGARVAVVSSGGLTQWSPAPADGHMTSESPHPRVVLVDGVPMSALVAQAREPRAVILAVHGGATSSAYFDCPGRPDLSLLRGAATRGFTAFALDRPGYGTSAFYAAEFADPARRVASSFAAVDKILAGADRGAGLFVLGHSAG